MNLRTPFSLGIRFWLNSLLALLLASSVWAKAAPKAPEWSSAKALQHSLVELKGIGNTLGSDPPDADAADCAAPVRQTLVIPVSLGVACRDQFNPMVHQLRDRLMHAPPSLL